MGRKSSAVFAGATGVPELDVERALALATDDELADQVEDAGLSEAKKKAQVKAEGMVDVLVDIAEAPTNTPGSRVSAAREVLHQAEGRPATQKENAVTGGLTIVLATFTVDGGTTHQEMVLPPPDVPLDDDVIEAAFDLEETPDGLVIDMSDLEEPVDMDEEL